MLRRNQQQVELASKVTPIISFPKVTTLLCITVHDQFNEVLHFVIKNEQCILNIIKYCI